MHNFRIFRNQVSRYLLVVFLFAGLLLFCSKSPTDGESGDSTNTDLETVTRYVTALGSADSLYLTLLDTQDRNAAVAAAIQYLQSLSYVTEAGMSPDSSVYVFYENGLLGCIYNPNLGTRPESGKFLSRPSSEYGGGEATGISYALLPFASEFGDASEMEVVDRINTCFGSDEPVTDVIKNEQVTVPKIADVLESSPGVLFWSGHGAMVPTAPGSGQFTVSLVSGESYTSSAIANTIISNYKDKALGNSREIVVIAHKGRHYLSVLPLFISRYADLDNLEGMGSNATKSIVYMCCCSSADADMANSFIDAGAEAYFGWDSPVSVAFASQTHKRFFKEVTDTCTAGEAYDLCSTGADPWKGARLKSFYGDRDVMVRAEAKMCKDGEDLRGYSVAVINDEATIVAGWVDIQDDSKTCSFEVSFPPFGPGTYNCQTDDDVVIGIVKMSSAKAYFVEKGLNGVSGTITVTRSRDDFVSGKFSGTLGYWGPGLDSSKDPPTETLQITNGFFKHTGKRF